MVARSTRSQSLDLFAICAPGLEQIVGGELASLELAPDTITPGGVSFRGGDDAMWRSNLWLRAASRVVARVGSFRARALGELERRARALPWERFLASGCSVKIHVTTHKSRLYHTTAIADRIASAIAGRVSGVSTAAPAPDRDADDAADALHPLVIVRVAHDTCLVSADSSGDLLHRRGYRLRTAKAPMRETLAAAMLLAARWDAAAPLLDPFCGSGTIPIEAALIARRMPPGGRRHFAFESWPGFSPARWRRAVDAARDAALPASPVPILASDRDAGAMTAARENAERAGVARDITFAQQPLASVTLPDRPGWIVTNPPYGVRVSDRAGVRAAYAQLGRLLRAEGADWHAAVMLADRSLGNAIGIELRRLLHTRNGGIPVDVAARP
ncbi:MAG: THUMP domain-containing class I SAM-dependent RNA methyltransferase [Gemmatimonadaceae bacterium]